MVRLLPLPHGFRDVEEGVLLEADVDERGLEAGVDVLDAALVDVADQRLVAGALDVEILEAAAADDRDAGLLLLDRVDQHPAPVVAHARTAISV